MPYIPNPSDKQITDIERAAADSSIVLYWFNGQYQQVGQIKHIKAYDLQVGSQSDAVKRYGNIIGSHNDKPWLK